MAGQKGTKMTDRRGSLQRVKTRQKTTAQTGRKRSPASAFLGDSILLDRINDGIVVFDAEMNYVYVNKTGGNILGRDPEDLIGKNYWTEYPEAKGTSFANAYIRALEQQETIVLEEYYPPFGRWFENRIYPSQDELVIFFTEITERKELELRLRSSEEELQRIVDTIPDGITIVNREGVISFANPAAERILGLSRTGITQRAYNDPQWKITALDGSPFPEEELPFLRVKASGQAVYNVEHAIAHPDGRQVALSISASPRLDKAGEFDGMVALFTDITERRRAELELQESEERFSIVFFTNPVSQSILSQITGQIIEVNDACCTLYGYSRAELLGADPGQLDLWVNPADQLAAVNELQQTGHVVPTEVTIREKSGEIRTVLFAVEPLTWKGIACLLTSSIDITDRKQAVAALREKEELLAMSQEMAHIGSWRLDLINNRLHWSDEVYRILGCQPQQFAATYEDFLGFVHPDDRKAVDEAYFGSLNDGKDGYKIELRIIKQSTGEVRYVHELCVHKRDATGRLIESVGNVQDITESKRDEIALQKSYQELTAIYRASQRLQKLISPDQLSQEIIEVLEETMDYTYCAVLLVQDDGETLVPYALSTQDRGSDFLEKDKEYVRSKNIRIGEGITGWVAQHGESVRVDDVQKDPRYLSVRQDIHSELCTPVRVQDSVVGVVNVESTQVGIYTEGDQRVLETIAAQISIAIQNARLLGETRLQRDRLADLSRQLIEAHESAQRAIGRELHDQVGQMLTALKITLEIIPQLPPELAAKKIAGAQDLLDELMARVSALSLELRPPMLDDLGLIPALLWHVNRFQEQTRIEVDFKHSGVEGRRFPIEIETVIYRVTQEALTNAARHAGANKIRLEVQLELGSDAHEGGGWLAIGIEDNGAGFEPQAAFSKHRGLSGMRERAELAGGQLHVQSQAGKGAKISVRLPVERAEA